MPRSTEARRLLSDFQSEKPGKRSKGFEGLRVLVTFENPKTPNPPGVSECERRRPTIGALIITYTILGVSYHSYSIMGPQTLF